MLQNRNIRHHIFALVMMLFLIPSAHLFCQSPDGRLSGAVKDIYGAAIPGAAVTATNIDALVERKAQTNSRGQYFLGNLMPGSYRLRVEATGRDLFLAEGVKIGPQESRILDVVMQGPKDAEIQIVWAPMPSPMPAVRLRPDPPAMPVYTSDSRLEILPTTSNDVMDVFKILNGYTTPGYIPFAANTQIYGGAMAPDVDILLAGLNYNRVRRSFNIQPFSRINATMAEEFTIIASPADAEYGWGVGHIRMSIGDARNVYHGSFRYNIQNDALNSNNWNQYNFSNNWNNQNNYVATFSGPLIRRRLVFFANWDQTQANHRSDITPIVLTPCARKGILRYFSGWDSRNAVSSTSASTAVPYRAVVNSAGVPLAAGLVPDNQAIALQPDGKTASSLQLQSVFGQLDSNARALLEQDPVNCSKYDPYQDLGVTTFWETNAPGAGFRGLDALTVPRFSALMPLPNNYSMMSNSYSNNGGDGLNTAVMKWTRKNAGSGIAYPGGVQDHQKDLNIHINYNVSDRHRLTGNYMIELSGGTDASRLWKDVGYEGSFNRRPQQFGFNLTSTLKPNMLNEARIGLARAAFHSSSPLNAPENADKAKDLLRYLVPTDNFPDYKNLPLIVGLGAEEDPSDMRQTAPPTIAFSPEGSGLAFGNFGNPSSHPYGTRNSSLIATLSGLDRRWMATDIITWMHGPHAVRAGGDIRLVKSVRNTDGSVGLANTALTYPTAFGGFTNYSIPQWTYPAGIGLVGAPSFPAKSGGGAINSSTGTLAGMIDLLTYMSGSISSVRQQYFVNNKFSAAWNEAIGKGETLQTTDIRRREFSLFVKDDWRMSPGLTLNLGARWEYYGVPWLDNGALVGLQGGPSAMFGISGRDIGSWMAANPVNLGDAYLTKEVFIGPNSPNPNQSLYRKDWNNIGPAAGFSWQLPWFGRGWTVLRGGYQLNYRDIGTESVRGYSDLAGVNGMTYIHHYSGDSANPYLSVADLSSAVPTSRQLDPAVVPLDTMKIRNHGVPFAAYDYNVRNPYTQSINLSLTRILRHNLTLDVRYVGTLARKSIGSIDLNTPNFINNGLLAALNEARKGGNPVLFDRMFDGIQFEHIGNARPVGAGGAYTGADIIRREWGSSLANGDYASIAASLANLNYDKTVFTNAGMGVINGGLPDIPAGEQGAVLRIANTKYPGMFPENYILANPQLSAAEYSGNMSHSNYHSMQVRVAMRPGLGVNLTSTYTLAKNLADQPGGGFWSGGSWTDPTNRALDYRPSYTPKHQWNTYGFMAVPIGPGGYFFPDVQNRIIRRIVEGWNLSWFLNWQSGIPLRVTGGGYQLYNNATLMDLAGPEKLAPGESRLAWDPGSYYGYYYGSGANARYSIGPDPQCSNQALLGGSTNYGWGRDGATPLSNLCTLQALYFNNPDGSRTLVLQQPLPGQQGTFGKYIEGAQFFGLDGSLGKNIQIDPVKSFTLRIDCSNILNHPSPGNPLLALSQYAAFGSVSGKTGNRVIQGRITFRF